MRLFFLLIVILFSQAATASVVDTLPPYLQQPRVLPPFTIQLPDSTRFTKQELPKRKSIVITYFDPECGHCQQEAAALSKNIHLFPKTFFVFATFKNLELVKEFSEAYGLDGLQNLRIGRELQYFLPVYYRVEKTPFTAVYDRKGRLLKSFREGYTIAQLQHLLN